MTVYCPTCSEGDCQEHPAEPESYTVPDAAHTSPHDVTVTYYATNDDADPGVTLQWTPATTSSCGTDHETGATMDTATQVSPGVTVMRMVPEGQVESLRETIWDLYRQLREEKRRVKEALGLLESAKEVCEEVVATPEQGPPLCADLGQHLELFLSQEDA